jgi:hypothetical protein
MTPMRDYYASGHQLLDLSNRQEVEYWLDHFTCSEIALRDALAVAGPLLAEVERYFLRQDAYFYLAARWRAPQFRSFAAFQAYQRRVGA